MGPHPICVKYHLHPIKQSPPVTKGLDADICVDADWCSYHLYEHSFLNYADMDTYADWCILATSLLRIVVTMHIRALCVLNTSGQYLQTTTKNSV